MKKILLVASALTLGACTTAPVTTLTTSDPPVHQINPIPARCPLQIWNNQKVRMYTIRNILAEKECSTYYQVNGGEVKAIRGSTDSDGKPNTVFPADSPMVDKTDLPADFTPPEGATPYQYPTAPAAASPAPTAAQTHSDNVSPSNYNGTGTPAYTPFTANDPDPSLLTEHSGTHSEAEANAWQAYMANHNGMSPMEVQAAYYIAHPECKCATPAQQAANPNKGWRD